MRTYIRSANRFAAFAAIALFLFGFGTVQQSVAQATSVKVPITMLVFIPCADGGNGELVEMSGTLNIVTATNIDANGCAHVKVHFQPQQLTGTGSVTGKKYQGTGVTQATTFDKTVCGEGCIIEENFNNNFRMIGQGPGNNYMVHENTRVRINICTNEVTIISSNSSIECL